MKFLVPLNKKTLLVKKQAFFLKCSQQLQFPIESRHFPHFSFPHDSPVVSLSLIGLLTFKDLISTLSWNGLEPPKSVSVNLIFVSFKKKKGSLFNLLPISSISVKEMRIALCLVPLAQQCLVPNNTEGLRSCPNSWASLPLQSKWVNRR